MRNHCTLSNYDEDKFAATWMRTKEDSRNYISINHIRIIKKKLYTYGL